METLTLRPTESDAGKRVDVWLSAQVEGLTRSAAQRLLEEGRAFSHGKVLKKNYRLQAGEEVVLTIPDPEPPAHLLPQAIPLDVRYEDEDVIVVNKPVGMVVHPAPGHPDGTLVNALLYHCGESLSGINGSLRPGIVHRPGYQRPDHRRQKRRRPRQPCRAAEGPLPAPDLRGRGGRRPAGGPGRHRAPHRPPPHRAKENGREPLGGPLGPDPLGGLAALRRLYPRPVPSGHRTDPSDPRPLLRHRPPCAGGPRLRRHPERLPRTERPVPPRPSPPLPPSQEWEAGGGGVPPAGVFFRSLDKVRLLPLK